jgi:hypothetical protein
MAQNQTAVKLTLLLQHLCPQGKPRPLPPTPTPHPRRLTT